MPETYEIPVRLDLAGARKDAQALDRLLEQVEGRKQRAAEKGAAAAEKAAEKGAQAAAAAERRKQAALEKIQDDFIRRDARRRANYEAMLERQSQAQVRAAERAEARKLAAAERAGQAAIRAAERKAAAIQAVEDRLFMQEQRRANQRAMIAERLARAEAQAAADAAKARSGDAARLGLGIAGAGAAAVAGAHLALGGRRAASEREAVEKLNQARDVARPVATLMEASADEALAKINEVRAAAGMGGVEASKFLEVFYGSAGASLEAAERTGGREGLAGDVAEAYAREAATQSRRRGGDAAVDADAAGTLPFYGAIRSAQEGVGRLARLKAALAPGRGEDPILSRQLFKSMSTMVGEGLGFSDPEQAAAVLGQLTLTAGPTESGTRLEQLNRAIQGGLADPTRSAWLKSRGVAAGMGTLDVLDRLGADIDAAQARGEGHIFLESRGYKSYEEREALIQGAKIRAGARGVYAGLPSTEAAGRAEVEANARFRRETGARMMAAAAATDAYDFGRAREAEGFYAAAAEKANSEATRAGDRSSWTFAGDLVRGLVRGAGPDTGRQARLEGQVVEEKLAEARRLRVPMGAIEDAYAQSAYEDNPNSAVARRLDQLIELQRRQLDAATRAVGGPGRGTPPPLARRPANQGGAP
jgi:hypothetical protein